MENLDNSCSSDDFCDYFESKDEDYHRDAVLFESLDQELQSIGADLVNVLRSNNKPANDAVLLTRNQIKGIEELKKNSEAFLTAFNGLSQLSKKEKSDKKGTAEAMTAEVKRLVCQGKERVELAENLYNSLQTQDTPQSDEDPVEVSGGGMPQIDSD